ncbi:aldehyde ferredoxin oxidoreductase family protein [Deferribacter autotrophicus]|uniref:Aldehyde ferredoxin oxidoreductase family protein n=1 Tax=Deferribacter autotrophicus TaxID=500465 RepID=A0A5A8F543_9BACT|nr:aldehyde ferredoxin oxidoreductase family protein [Deferribacter autotrophicus]KAA0259201.1 aldehyde ferredoxin oxidoreductase family protein [Deferribacter autotrophicus]
MLKNDSFANVLYIDLTEKRFWIERREDLFNENIGGSGVAISLLHEECPENCDPLSPENPIIFAVGPLTGLFPLASKTVAMFKSPHTNNLGESHCGGRSAIAIRMAGYGAIVIRGRSDFPVYIAIHGNKVYFRDASALWGMRSSFTAGRIIREKEPGEGLRTIMRIGRAGEKQVSYACVTTETYRHFGRLGLGAVFGSKNLKAIIISGKRSLPVVDNKQYKRLYSDIYKVAVSTPAMKKYHDLGTPQNVLPLNELGGLPTRNLKETRFEKARELSGENFAENYLGRRIACAHCPVGCVHIAVLRDPYGDEPYFYKTSMISYDYEPIYALGFMLGLPDVPSFLKLMDKIEVLGLDVMSAGVILAWATEALERGIISIKETMGVEFKWGELDQYLKAIDLIVEQPNEFYQALARGVEYASSKYGGKDFALAFGKNEMPGYHTGPAAHLGYSIGARHSHLDNAGYSIDQKVLTKKSLSPREMAEALISEEQWRQILSSLVICFFAREVYKPEIVSESLKVAGFELGIDELKEIGKKIFYEKYKFKFREGFSFDSLRLPKRIFETPSPLGKLDEGYMRSVLEHVKEIIK